MKKTLFCVSLVLAGLMTSCVDKYQEVDADSKPSWLGESIYAELKNPNQDRLTGTFSTYLRLVDDLGYDEVLSRTGSKTVFPANDEAFQRFFSSNQWGVSSYEQLSEAQKKLLLYSSMLDNALLLGLLPNVSNGTAEPNKGEAVKHATNVSVIDTIQHLSGAADMPKGNPYWEKYYNTGIDVVSDATRPMMVHLTREYMLNNDIITVGEGSDFEILTGTPFQEGTAYIFNDRVINGDVTCQNGYIHQLEDVLVPPGNMAQVLRRHEKTQYFSRILDHFAVPYFDATTTRQYNDWAKSRNLPEKDSIFQMRYLSTRSQGAQALTRDPNGNDKRSTDILQYDPGWNQYFPGSAEGNVDASIKDIGAFFVPDDDAVKSYFLPGGAGSHLIEIYGSRANTEGNLMENLDSLHSKKPDLLASFVRNLMKPNFTTTVPSKFPTVSNDASENMGLKVDMIDRKSDGKYDITIANNGVIYVINNMIVPDEHNSVMAPASQYPDMRIMGWAIQDSGTESYLSVDYKYYLLAMSANYAFFIPEDKAFDYYYIDPASLGHVGPNGAPRPDVLHIYYDTLAVKEPYVKCIRYYYNPETGEVDKSVPRAVDNPSNIKTQFVDILNYHTLVLNAGQDISSNHYFKTKHGGEVYIPEGNVDGGHVMSGGQIEKPGLLPAPTILTRQHQKNGWVYRLDRIIQPPTKSVYKVLQENPDRFSEFLQACTGFQATEVLEWAGISSELSKVSYTSEQDAYTIFTNMYRNGTKDDGNGGKVPNLIPACLDYNVKMFNTYNYTLFAPDNTAMQKAYADGLPNWEEIEQMYTAYVNRVEAYNATKGADDPDYTDTASDKADMARAKVMIRQIRDFIRYHFVSNSVYADNTIETGRYQSLSSDDSGIAKEVVISGGNGQIVVTDLKAGHSVTVSASDSGKLINQMTRDYWMGTFDSQGNNVPVDVKSATNIYTSSFCAVHQISEPLYGNASGKFNE